MESNKYKVKILPEAESDLREIFDYMLTNYLIYRQEKN